MAWHWKPAIDSPWKWDGLSVRHIPLELAFPRKPESLTGKFVIVERNGCKTDPAQVEKDMRTADKNSDTGLLLLSCCIATQRIGLTWYVSGNRRRCRMPCKRHRSERQELLDETEHKVGLTHPITFDLYDLYEYYHQNKLSAFNVQMLKIILSHLEVPFKSKEKKSILILSKLWEVIEACNCDATRYD